MDNIFSYWPLLFLLLAVITRIINFLNKKNNVIKKSKADTSTDQEINMDNLSDKNEKDEFEYDKEKFKERYQNVEEKDEKNQKEKKKRSKKLKVKKVKQKSKKKLFVEKEDIIKGIIMKEILDEPRFKKNSSKNN
ncbi:MAG: hypothetical protein K9K76_00460 [Halanaerobiales bacterium]|nr:hypothetical protein [Halanaerobiales bacterium]